MSLAIAHPGPHGTPPALARRRLSSMGIIVATVVEALIAAAARLLGPVVAWGLSFVPSRQPPAHEAVHRVEDVYDALQACLSAARADRVLVLQTVNGGGIPRVDRPLYSTIMYEVTQMRAPIRPRWQKQLLDEHYVRMMSRLITEGSQSLNADELPDGAMLKDTYESAEIRHSEVRYLGTSPTSVMYLSVVYCSDDELDASQREAIRAGANELSQVFATTFGTGDKRG